MPCAISGHDVLYIAELTPSFPDDEVLDAARRADALLITGDTDFGELVFRQDKASGGVVLLRLSGLSVEREIFVITTALATHAEEMRGRFTILSPGSVRIRTV